MLIEENDYLSNVYKPYRQNLYSRYSEAFELFKEYNLFLLKEQINIPLRNSDKKGKIIVALFAKSLTTFQAIFNLFGNYYCNDANNLTRVLFEEMVNIIYCSKGEDEFKKFCSLEIIHKIEMLEIIHKDFKKKDRNNFFKKKSYEERTKELYDKLYDLKIEGLFDKKNKPKPITIRQRVERLKSSEILNYYKTYYKLISCEIHSSPESLDKYFNFDNKGNLIEINCGPKTEECNIAKIFFTSIRFMDIIFYHIINYFEIPKKKEINNFIKKFNAILNKYQKLKYIDKKMVGVSS